METVNESGVPEVPEASDQPTSKSPTTPKETGPIVELEKTPLIEPVSLQSSRDESPPPPADSPAGMDVSEVGPERDITPAEESGDAQPAFEAVDNPKKSLQATNDTPALSDAGPMSANHETYVGVEPDLMEPASVESAVDPEPAENANATINAAAPERDIADTTENPPPTADPPILEQTEATRGSVEEHTDSEPQVATEEPDPMQSASVAADSEEPVSTTEPSSTGQADGVSFADCPQHLVLCLRCSTCPGRSVHSCSNLRYLPYGKNQCPLCLHLRKSLLSM